MTLIQKIYKRIYAKISLWVQIVRILPDYIRFVSKDTNKHCPASILTMYPCLSDKTAGTDFERAYVYHIAWAARCIQQDAPKKHVDFGSLIHFSAMLSAFIPVAFYDYRPAEIGLSGITSQFGNLLDIALPSNSVDSLSCLHTIEHVGLGRYGDPLDPEGDLRAIEELKRITKIGGSLYVVVPMGTIQRTEFNGHRVYAYDTFITYFEEFTLVDFSYIPEHSSRGGILLHTSKESIKEDKLGCGCFWFKKNE